MIARSETHRPGTILLSDAQICARVAELAAELDTDYAGEDLLLLGILNSAVMLMADLSRRLTHEQVEMAWIEVASFGPQCSASGVIRIRSGHGLRLVGRKVVVVDCVALSGRTLDWTLAYIGCCRAASAAALVLACDRSLLGPCGPVKYAGFTVLPGPVAGYGVDYRGRYGNLPHLVSLAVQEDTRPLPAGRDLARL